MELLDAIREETTTIDPLEETEIYSMTEGLVAEVLGVIEAVMQDLEAENKSAREAPARRRRRRNQLPT